MYRPASSSKSIYPPDTALTAPPAAAASSPPLPTPPLQMTQTQNPPSLPSSFFESPYCHNIPSLDLGTLTTTSSIPPPFLRPPKRTNDFRHLPPLPKYLPPTGSASTSILPIAALSFTFKKLRRRDPAVPIERLLTSEPSIQPFSHRPYPSQHVTSELSPASDIVSGWSSLAQAGPSQRSKTSSAVQVNPVSGSTANVGWKADISSPTQLTGKWMLSHESTFGKSECHKSYEAASFPQHRDEEVPSNINPAEQESENKGISPIRQDRDYKLRIRQQPIAARACGFGERDRRVIDPPPILELLVTDPKTGLTDTEELRYPLNVMHCTLWNAEGTNEETAVNQPDRTSTRRLMGQLVASPSVAKDEFDCEGCFFCFPDLSCRTHGKYRLRFMLMRIDMGNLHVGGFSPILAETLSDVFTVYSAKDFPGMRSSSALTRALKLQGCNIQVKKGNEKTTSRRRAASSDNENERAEPSVGKGKRRRK